MSSTTVSSNTTSVTTVVSSTASNCNLTDYNCTLTDFFYECAVNLTSSEYTNWVEWVSETRNDVLADCSLTDDEKVAAVGFSLEAFFEINTSIKKKLYFQKLNGWGSMFQLVYVAYDIQMEASSSIVELDSNSDCVLFEALRSATSNDNVKASEVEKLIAQITVVLKTSSWSYTQQQAQVYLLFESFYSVHASWKDDFEKIKIKGFGSLHSYVEAAHWVNFLII